MSAPAGADDGAACAVREAPGALVVVLSGRWVATGRAPDFAPATDGLRRIRPAVLSFDCTSLAAWDSLLVVRLLACRELCAELGVRFDDGGLPASAVALMKLARTVPPHERPRAAGIAWWRRPFALAPLSGLLRAAGDVLEFIGDVVRALGSLAAGRANMRVVDLFYFIQQAGPAAVGIITLTSVLVGMILAYLGAVQLKQFGAEIYVADLVGLGMVREMGALMTAVIMAGRTGAAYAAQLGTMQTREEIDAITTLGISPIEFLVLPRLLALLLIMPLLCMYANALGILGGALVAGGLGISWSEYLTEMQTTMTLAHIGTGLAKSLVFGLLIALAGCRAGIRCGRSSEAVGNAATEAVVVALVLLIVADAAFNIVYQRLGI